MTASTRITCLGLLLVEQAPRSQASRLLLLLLMTKQESA
jgi:hypothetical protein